MLRVLGVCLCVCACVGVCMCVKREGGGCLSGARRGGERMIETSNQSHCREQRAGRGLLPVVTLLSVAVFLFFPSHADQ